VANTPSGGAEEHGSEHGRVNPPSDLEPVPQGFELPRGHPLGGHEEVMKAGRSGKADPKSRRQDGLRVPEAVFRMFDREKL